MKVWWVIGWDYYYPSSDNFVASFATENEAYAFIKSIKRCYNNYEVIDISERL